MNTRKYSSTLLKLKNKFYNELSCRINSKGGHRLCFADVVVFLFLLFLLVFGVNSCDNQNILSTTDSKIKRETVWRVDILTDQNKSIIAIKEYNINGQVYQSTSYDYDGDKEEESTFIYFGNSSQENKTKYYENGNERGTEKIRYSFDDKGRIIFKEVMINGDTAQILQNKYEYDALGNLIKVIAVGKNSTIEQVIDYKYDNSGKIFQISYNKSQSDNKRDSLVYNSEKNSVKIFTINSNSEIINIVEYVYNGQGRVINTNFYTKESVLEKKYRHYYQFY